MLLNSRDKMFEQDDEPTGLVETETEIDIDENAMALLSSVIGQIARGNISVVSVEVEHDVSRNWCTGGWDRNGTELRLCYSGK